MEAHYTVYLVFISFMKTEGKLNWTIENKVSDYGQNLTLICQVSSCCSKEAGWEAWEPTLRTIFIDIRDLTVPATSKYTGDVHNFGYSLIIRNVSMEDVNIMYTCVYGDDRSDKKMLWEKDIFLSGKKVSSDYKKNDSTSKVAHQPSNINQNEINIEFKESTVIGLIVAGVFVVAAAFGIIFHRKRKNLSKNKKPINREANTTTFKKEPKNEPDIIIHLPGSQNANRVQNTRSDTPRTGNIEETENLINKGNNGETEKLIDKEEDKIQSSQQFEEKKERNNSDQVLAPQEPAQRPIQSVLPLEHSQQQAKSENESGQDINLVDTGREHTANKKDADDERSQLSQKSEETMQPNTSEQVQLSFEKETFQSPQQFEEQNEPNNSDQVLDDFSGGPGDLAEEARNTHCSIS